MQPLAKRAAVIQRDGRGVSVAFAGLDCARELVLPSAVGRQRGPELEARGRRLADPLCELEARDQALEQLPAGGHLRALAAISCADALVCWAEADNCSVAAEADSATDAISATSLSTVAEPPVISCTAWLIALTASFIALTVWEIR